MKFAYVGRTQRSLASGRPLAFGDTVDESELTPEDELLRADLAEASTPPDPPAPVPSADEQTTSEQKA